MNLLDIYKNQTDYLNIKLKSDAFDDGEPFFYKEKPEDYYQEISEVHKVLYRLDKNKPLSINIHYGQIQEEYLDEVVDLHKEWFPFLYDRDYFKRYILKKNSVAIGAFLKLGQKEYLIGCAIGEIISEQKFKNALPGILIERSWYDVFSAYVDCGYLHSLGVIDEYRKLNVGSRLLELFIDDMKRRNTVVLYANVILHNNSAIKFLEANNWHLFGIEKNHYKYRDNLYDGKVYYYILNINWCNTNNTKEIENNNGENKDGYGEIQTSQRGCWESLFGGYFSGNSSNNKKYNNDMSSNNEIKSDEKNEEV